MNLRQRAFTLIELMVALALGLILIGAIVVIFSESQKIYGEMEAKVSVYQYARYAFDQAERDLANCVKTADMEYYQDNPNGGIRGHYDIDPVTGQDIESLPLRDRGQIAHKLFPDEKYIYAMTLDQPAPYDDGRGQGALSLHRRDSIYFRTIISVNGQSQPVLVEYALDYLKPDGSTLRTLPRLVRRTWVITNQDNSGLGGTPVLEINGGTKNTQIGKNEPIETELCLYVTDVIFEFYLTDKRNGRPGRFYSAEQATIGQLPNGQPDRIKMRNFSQDPGGYKIACFYDERHNGAIDTATYDPDTEFLTTASGFGFPMCQPGDKVLFLGNAGLNFRSGDYTIRSIEPITPGSPRFGLRFNEDVPPPTSGSGASSAPSPAATRFRVGWLPPMVRMTLKIKDERKKAIRTVSRQFKLLGA